MKVERVPIASLKADPENVRRHDAAGIEGIMQSLAEFGQQYPIVVERPDIVRKGNGTLAAAAALGWTEINVVYTDLVGARAKAYAIKDNATSDDSSFDPDLLAAALGDLVENGVDLDSLGLKPEPDDDDEEDDVELVKHSTLPPPRMSWVLIGLPTVRFGEIAQTVESLAKIPGIMCETAVNGTDD